jgi:hypothetical protein
MIMIIPRIVVPAVFLAQIVGGSAFADDTHLVKALPAKATLGSATVVSVTIEGRNGWHINSEAPISLKVSPPPGVSVAKQKLGRADLVESTDTKARFDVSATLAEVGAKTISAEATFVVCQETACKPVKETLSLTVSTEAPSAPTTKSKAKGKRKA